jgi:hypothetical protein
MAGHYKVVVEIKETVEPAPIMNPNGYPVKGIGGAEVLSERRVIDRLKVVVSAGDEEEAVQRVISMLRSQARPTVGEVSLVDTNETRPK